MEIYDLILKMLKLKPRPPKKRRKNMGAHLELWGTQAPTPCDCIATWHAFNRRGFPNGQSSIYQGSETYGFSCQAFETGTTWNFYFIPSTVN